MPYYNRDPTRDHNFDNYRHEIQDPVYKAGTFLTEGVSDSLGRPTNAFLSNIGDLMMYQNTQGFYRVGKGFAEHRNDAGNLNQKTNPKVPKMRSTLHPKPRPSKIP